MIEGDIRDEKIWDIMREYSVDYVIHNTAQPGVRSSVEDPRRVNDVNATGTLKILLGCMDANVDKFIYASSSSVYGRVVYLPLDEEHPTTPISPYGVSKLAAEHYCRVFHEIYGLKTVSLRLFTVYGPRMRPDLAISVFTRRALKNEPIEVFGDGSYTRDFTYVSDVVEAYILAMNRGAGIYNIGYGRRLSINELVKKIIKITGSKSRIIYTTPKKGDVEHTWANNEKAKKELGWKPEITIDEGLKMFVDWMLDNTNLYK
jgi:UDP-glucose 4-epimerase